MFTNYHILYAKWRKEKKKTINLQRKVSFKPLTFLSFGISVGRQSSHSAHAIGLLIFAWRSGWLNINSYERVEALAMLSMHSRWFVTLNICFTNQRILTLKFRSIGRPLNRFHSTFQQLPSTQMASHQSVAAWQPKSTHSHIIRVIRYECVLSSCHPATLWCDAICVEQCLPHEKGSFHRSMQLLSSLCRNSHLSLESESARKKNDFWKSKHYTQHIRCQGVNKRIQKYFVKLHGLIMHDTLFALNHLTK